MKGGGGEWGGGLRRDMGRTLEEEIREDKPVAEISATLLRKETGAGGEPRNGGASVR